MVEEMENGMEQQVEEKKKRKSKTKNLLKTKQKKDKPKTERVKGLKELIETDTNARNKRKKKIHQTFIEDFSTYETDKVIYRIMFGENQYKDIIKNYPTSLRFNKFGKIGCKTKMITGEWMEFIDIITDQKDLIFVLKPLDPDTIDRMKLEKSLEETALI